MTINFCACILVLIGAFIGADSPLTVTQMLWVNLIMDTFAAMALSSLPADPTVMTDRPRRQDEHILNKAMTTRIIGTGLAFFGILIFLWEMLLHNPGITSVKEIFSTPGILASTLHNDIESGMHLSDIQRGIFFSIFVMMQFWNMFNAKAYMTGSSAFKGLGSNSAFLVVCAVIVLGQWAIVTFGGTMFNVVPLSLESWVTIIASTSAVLWVGEAIRLSCKKG
jgi:Ca2+-transporting ATPase